MIDKVLVAKFDVLELHRARQAWYDLRHFSFQRGGGAVVVVEEERV